MFNRKAHVILDGDYIPLDSVKVTDIEEGIGSGDVVTFEYEGEQHQSLIVLHPA
jgi:hypothetical protein